MNNDTTIIYHRADYDGQFSGAVCAIFLKPKAENVIGWDYGDPLIEFPKEGPVYLVDLSPDCFASIPVDVADRLIWIDHHKSSIEKWDRDLGYPLKGYRIDGVAACRLCWQYFTYKPVQDGYGHVLPVLSEYQNRDVDEPLALTLAGEYDVWDKRDDRSELFQYGLTVDNASWPGPQPYSIIRLLGDLEPVSRQIADRATLELVEYGRSARRWHQAFARQVCQERGYLRMWEGLKFWVLASCHARNSMWFEGSPECDALMNWRYTGDGKIHFSLYHKPGREDIDLSLIAQKYGGGGHRGACGFSLDFQQAMGVI